MPKPLSFTPEQVADIRARLDAHESWDAVGRIYGCTGTGVRRFMDPVFRKLSTDRARENEARRARGEPPPRRPGRPRKVSLDAVSEQPQRRPPRRRQKWNPEWKHHTPKDSESLPASQNSRSPQAIPPAIHQEARKRLAERDTYLESIADIPRTTTQEFFGDPLPGRSALDRLRNQGGHP